MNLDSMTAEIRPRESWEAVDLGIALTRRDYSKIILAKMLVVWPVWGALIFLLRDHFWWLALTIWWINAVWENVPLYFISRRLFGGNENLRSFLKAWPGWSSKRLLYLLLTGRFSVNRSLQLPAIMLEGVEGGAISRRVKGLQQFSGMIGVKVTAVFFICLHSCWAQLVLLLYWLIPALSWREVSVLFHGGEGLPESFLWACLCCYLLVSTLLTPFYVGAGFGMYLNTRTKMEGWDVELIFRKMAQRIAATTVSLILALTCLANSQGAPAEVDPQKTMEKVLSDDAFIIHSKTEKFYVRDPTEFGNDRRRDRHTGRSSNRSIRNRGGAGQGIDATFIGWIALAAVATYILILVARMLTSRIEATPTIDAPKAETVLGMSVSQKSLPKDIVTQARELWESGDTRGSLALLYRGSLSWLIYKGGVSIRESDTEIDCLNRSNQTQSGRSQASYFKALTLAWIKVAYGKENPSSAEMRHLLDDWPFDKRKSSVIVKSSITILMLTLVTGCGNYEVKEETREIGYKGRAKVYPFLAVENFLSEMSVSFERIYTFTEMPNTASVILYPSEVDNRKDKAEVLLNWVGDGGSVVYLLEGTDPFSPWTLPTAQEGKKKSKKKHDTKDEYLFLENLEVKVVDSVKAIDSAKWGDKTYQWDLQKSAGFVVPKKMWNEARGYRIGESRKSVSVIQIDYGDGLITLVGQAKPWRNRYVGNGDHASVLWDILNRGKEGLDTVWLVRGSRASFWGLLKKFAWMPLLSSAIYVLVWLWKSMPRFGPLIPDKVEGTRDFHEHLLMTGRFFVRQNLIQALVEPVQRRLTRKLKRFTLTGDAAEWGRLSDTTGIPEQSLRWALEPNRLQPSKKEYAKLIQILQQIDQKL